VNSFPEGLYLWAVEVENESFKSKKKKKSALGYQSSVCSYVVHLAQMVGIKHQLQNDLIWKSK